MHKSEKMTTRFFYILLAFLTLASCQDDTEKRRIENERDAKKKETVFATINNAWHFNTQPLNASAGELNASWNEWRIFLNELSQKPQSTIGAFRKKAKTLSLKVADLNKNIPVKYNKPEIKARIAVLLTKINSLNLFVNLGDIPEKKVVALIGEINVELASLQMQFGEIVRKSEIPREEGELDMIRLLDTSRAIPTNKPPVPLIENQKPKGILQK